MSFSIGSNLMYLKRDTPEVTAVPLTMACWFKPQVALSQNLLMSLADTGAFNQFYMYTTSGASSLIQAGVYSGGSSEAETTTSYGVLDEWHHAVAVFASSTSRSAYLDGGGKGTNTQSRTPTGLLVSSIGNAFYVSGQGGGMKGLIAEAAMWSAALTDGEVLSLSQGASPLLIRPQSLVMYVPGLSLGGGVSPNLVGAPYTVMGATSIAEHPRTYLPSGLYRAQVTAGSGGGGDSGGSGVAGGFGTQNYPFAWKKRTWR